MEKAGGYMATDQGPVVQSALLRNELVRLRVEANLTQEHVARALEWSVSKVIRMEGGRGSLTRTDLQALLTQYGVTSQTRHDRLLELNRGARQRGWWGDYKGVFKESYLNFIGYEAGASFIRQFHSGVVPGLLQIPEYAEAVDSAHPDAPQVSVRVLLRRQRELADRQDSPHQLYVLDEAVIRRHIGVMRDPQIMPRQLAAIADRAEHDELVTVRIIPFSSGAHFGLGGAFTLLEFEGGLDDMLFLDGNETAGMLVTGNDERLNLHRDAFEHLLDESLSPLDSLDLIRSTAKELSP